MRTNPKQNCWWEHVFFPTEHLPVSLVTALPLVQLAAQKEAVCHRSSYAGFRPLGSPVFMSWKNKFASSSLQDRYSYTQANCTCQPTTETSSVNKDEASAWLWVNADMGCQGLLYTSRQFIRFLNNSIYMHACVLRRAAFLNKHIDKKAKKKAVTAEMDGPIHNEGSCAIRIGKKREHSSQLLCTNLHVQGVTNCNIEVQSYGQVSAA